MAYDGTSSFALSPENEDTLAQALKFAEAGIPVLPTHGLREDGRCTCGNDGEEHRKNRGKHPAVGHGHNDATLDGARLIQWFGADRGWNVAVPGGEASGLLFLDADVVGGGLDTLDQWFELGLPDLPQTLRCRTGGGGLHIVYALPPGAPRLKSGRVLPGIDLKCDGGYVVTAPSRHHSGGRYRWIEPDVVVATAPDDLVVWLLTTPRIKAGGGVGGSGGEIAGYDFVAFLRDGCPPGARDEFFNELAFRARKVHHLDESQALELVRREWERVEQGDHPFSWDEARAKVRNVYAKAHLAPDVKSDPRLTALAASWAATVNGQAPPVVPQAVFSDGGGEVAESTAGVGSSGQAGGGGGSGGGPGPAVLGQPPELETELTQTGNAHRYVKLFGPHVRFVHGLGWHIWDGTRWRPDDKDDAFHLTLGVLEALNEERRLAAGNEDRQTALARWRDTSSGMSARQAILTGAASDPRMKTTVNELDKDPWLLVVENGTVDLRTGTLRASAQEDLNTRCAAVVMDLTAECPEWEKHVRLVTSRKDGVEDPGLTAYVQRWVGYTLTGLVKEQKLFFGFGKGDNGKNVLIETVLGLMGTYAQRGGAKLLAGGQEHETIIADLAGARMVFIDETPKGKVNEARLKELTGSSRIRARKIAQDSFEFDARFKLWIAGNNKPHVDESNDGFWRRLDLVPFDVKIPRERRIPGYGEVLKAEWPGILNWALAGLRDYQEVGLGQPDRVKSAVAEYREEEDPVGQFLAETFAEGMTEDNWVWYANETIHGLYTRWCQSQGIKFVMTMNRLGMELAQHGYDRDPQARYVVLNANLGGEMKKNTRGRKLPPLTSTLPMEINWQLVRKS